MKKIKIGPFKDWNVEGNLIVLPANREDGFYYGYVIYIPNTVKSDTTLIVEGSNCNVSSSRMDMALKKYTKKLLIQLCQFMKLLLN